ncbi:MAG: DUF4330 family protein, partial [Patescibacteria group bacterium]
LTKLTLADAAIAALGIGVVLILAFLFFRKTSYLNLTIKINEESVAYDTWAVFNRGTRSWFGQMFYPGMKEKDGLGKTSAEVLQVRTYNTFPGRQAAYLTVKLRATYNRGSNQYIYRGKPVLIGNTIKLFLDNVLAEGLITHIEGVPDPRQKTSLTVQVQLREETPVYPETSGTRPYVAEAIKAGDQIVDNQGNVAIKVLDKEVSDAKRLVTTSDGRVSIQSNPLRKDVFLTLLVNALKIGDQYFVFDDVPILTGIEIQLNFPNIFVGAEVVKFLSTP